MPTTPTTTTDFKSYWQHSFGTRPYPWQQNLAAERACQNRLIHIPTGFGKTQGVLAAWTYHRLIRKDPSWPRRLIWCLPMRVLVEQTLDVARQAIEQAGLGWDGKSDHQGKVGVHALMGGAELAEWHLYPEAEAILVGTQDMLLSRALNRGYAAHRPRWPIDLGLLSQDVLWVMDEVQLMDVGLSTSAQLQTFRDHLTDKALRPAHSWWMSATLQRRWLESVDTRSMIQGLPLTRLPAEEKQGTLWEQTRKPLHLETQASIKTWAASIAKQLLEQGEGKLSLVITNRVKNAMELHKQLQNLLKGSPLAEDLRLVHSRFRPAERAAWREQFLSPDSPLPSCGRVIVATQVVEAGVDLDADLLFTELSPWPSLVQRVGRAARRGGTADIFVTSFDYKNDKSAAPYALSSLESAWQQLQGLDELSPAALDRHEAGLGLALRAALYPYAPSHLLLEHEWHELFDTSADLGGADVDISRFIRSGDQRDVQVFWRDLPKDKAPSKSLHPGREELCSVPFLEARDWLFGKGKGRGESWVWDWLDGNWSKPQQPGEIYPGRVLLVNAKVGGYSATHGFNPKTKGPVPMPQQGAAKGQPLAPEGDEQAAGASQESEAQSAHPWKTIGTHTREVANTAAALAKQLEFPERFQRLVALAGQWHDLGKSHPAFQGSMRHPQRPERQDLAKAPDEAWSRGYLYQLAGTKETRRSFRHELASVLALFDLLHRHNPAHPALLGPWTETFELLQTPYDLSPTGEAAPTPAEQEILDLEAEDFNLFAWLVLTHHGKLHSALTPSPKDQEAFLAGKDGLPIRGVYEGDLLPSLSIKAGEAALPGSRLSLAPAAMGLSPATGMSWAERVLALQQRYGPSTLALLEACLRAADVRASRLDTPDPVLEQAGTSPAARLQDDSQEENQDENQDGNQEGAAA